MSARLWRGNPGICVLFSVINAAPEYSGSQWQKIEKLRVTSYALQAIDFFPELITPLIIISE